MPARRGISDAIRADNLQRVESENGDQLKDLSPADRNNEQIVLVAVKRNRFAFKHASSKLKANKNFVLRVIAMLKAMDQTESASDEGRGHGILEYVSESLKNDRAVVRAAIDAELNQTNAPNGLSYCALEFASKRLRSDPTICTEAVTKNSFAMRHVSKKYKGDWVELRRKSILPDIKNSRMNYREWLKNRYDATDSIKKVLDTEKKRDKSFHINSESDTDSDTDNAESNSEPSSLIISESDPEPYYDSESSSLIISESDPESYYDSESSCLVQVWDESDSESNCCYSESSSLIISETNPESDSDSESIKPVSEKSTNSSTDFISEINPRNNVFRRSSESSATALDDEDDNLAKRRKITTVQK